MIDFNTILAESGLTQDKLDMLESFARKTFIEAGIPDDNFQHILLYAYTNGLITFEHDKINDMAKQAETAILIAEKQAIEQKITQIDARLGEIEGV